MKLSVKVLVAVFAALLLPSIAMASVGGNAIPHYNYAQIFAVSSTVDLIPSTNGSGNVWGVKCIFPSNGAGASVKLQFTVDGGTVRTITLDPTFFEQDVNSRFVSGWVPMDIAFSTSIRIQMNNTSVGTATIDCWASWGTN